MASEPVPLGAGAGPVTNEYEPVLLEGSSDHPPCGAMLPAVTTVVAAPAGAAVSPTAANPSNETPTARLAARRNGCRIAPAQDEFRRARTVFFTSAPCDLPRISDVVANLSKRPFISLSSPDFRDCP